MSDVLQKSKRKYFNNLNEKNTFDNKKFWKVIKSLLSNRIISNEKVTIVEGDKMFEWILACLKRRYFERDGNIAIK